MRLLSKRQISSIKYQVFLVLTCLLFFWPFVLKGKIPIPADTIVGMYHPWRDAVWDNFQSGVPFKNYLITDPVRQQYLWKKLVIDQYKKLNWPLWNFYTHAGMPLLANFQAGAFYPANLLFFALPFNSAWGVYILLQLVLGSLFLYWFLRNLRLQSLTCFFGSLVFAFGGFATAWLEWGNIGHTILWLPLILLSIEKLIGGRNSLWCGVFIFSLVSQFFAGHLQTSFYVLLFSVIYLVFRLSLIKKKDIRLKFYFLFSIYYFLFTLVTTIQWLPTLELIQNSAREIDQARVLQRSDWFLPFKHLIQLIVPDFFGNPTTLNYWGEWNYGEFVSFIGVIPFFFVLLSVFSFKREKFVKFFLLSCLFFLSFALPTPWAKLPLYLKIPFIGSAQPSRLVSLIDFCLAVLAAFGFNQLLFYKKFWRREIILSLTCVFLLIGSLWFFVFQAANFWPKAGWIGSLSVSKRNLILPSAFLGILLFLLIARLLFIEKLLRGNTTREKAVVICWLLFILFTIGEVFRFGWKFTPFSSPEWIFPQTKTIEFLKRDKSLYRFLSVDRRLFPANFAIAYGLQTISGYDPLYLKDYARLITKIESGQDEIASFNRIVEPANYNSEIVDRLNVKYVLSLQELDSEKLVKVFQEGQTHIFENKNYLPRIRLFPEEKEDKVIIENYDSNKIRLKIKAGREKELVMADNFYPGWQVEINKKKYGVWGDEDNFRRVKVPAGDSQIEFYFFPQSFKIALIVSMLGILLFLINLRLAKKIYA